MDNNKQNSHIMLHYEIHGKGSPIIFLHGFGANIYSWRNLINPLSEHFQLILIDLKGFGASPKPRDNSYSIHDQAALIYQFIIEHDLKNLTIVGNSYGGAVALVTALKLHDADADRLTSLVLIDSIAYEQQFPTFIKILRSPFLGSIGLYLLPSTENVRQILKLAYYDDSKITMDQISAYATPIDLPGGRQALIKIARQIVPPNISEMASKYKTIQVPTLILWGQQDEIVPIGIGERLHESMANSEFLVLNQCGHIPHEERPTETIDIISSFLMRNNEN